VSSRIFELKPAARRELRQLDMGPRQEAIALILELADEGPRIAGAIELRAIELRANPDLWRVRFHDGYRMIYRVVQSRKLISVLRIRPRLTAYKGMKH
jgi:mRNA-degrading endonuclease RelE of RelBE toxin-antitoxin system